MDDSIVRGTTSKRLVNIFKHAGAKEIHFVSASPPIIAPCFLGVDTPEKEHLIAANHTEKEIKRIADSCLRDKSDSWVNTQLEKVKKFLTNYSLVGKEVGTYKGQVLNIKVIYNIITLK